MKGASQRTIPVADRFFLLFEQSQHARSVGLLAGVHQRCCTYMKHSERSSSLMVRIPRNVRRTPTPRDACTRILRSGLLLLMLMTITVGYRSQRRQAHRLGTSVLLSLMFLSFLMFQRYRRWLRVHALVNPAQHDRREASPTPCRSSKNAPDADKSRDVGNSMTRFFASTLGREVSRTIPVTRINVESSREASG